MKKRLVIALCIIVVLLPVAGIFASERQAAAVGSVILGFREYDNMQVVRVTGWNEVALKFDDNWALVTGAGAGSVSTDAGKSATMWFLGLGARRMIMDRNDIQALISGEWANSGKDYMVIGASLIGTHRFLPDESSLIPYISGGVSMQNVKATSWAGAKDNFTALMLHGTVGFNFTIGKDYDLMTEISLFDSSDFSKSVFGNYADGWSAALGLRYFFGHE